MENKYINVAKGLRLFRKGNILGVVASIVTILGSFILLYGTGVGIGLASQSGGVIIILGVILTLIAGVIQIVALVKNSAFHTGYKTALALVVVNIVFVVVTSRLLNSAFTTVISVIIAFLMFYFVVNATIDLLREKGKDMVAKEGKDLRDFYIICTVIIVVAPFLMLIPILGIFVGIITLCTSLLQLVLLFKYIGFLGQAATALEEQAEQF